MNHQLALIAPQVTFVVIIVMDGFLFHLLPRLTRPDLYFAVTVPPDFRDSSEAASILQRYRREVWVHSLIALGLVLLIPQWLGKPAPPVLLAGLFWQLIGCFLACLRARRRVTPRGVAPSTVREADLAPRPARFPGGWVLQAGPFAILAGVALWLQFHWEQIPDRFPVHWGIDGKPNGWATRSFSGVFGPLIIAASICATMLLLAYGILHWTRRINVRGGPGQSEIRFQHTGLSVLLAVEYLMALLFGWVGTLALRGPAPMVSPLAVLVPTLAVTVLMVVVLIRTGQGGSRLPEYQSILSPAAAPVGDRTPDRYWIAGMFYFNKDDPAIFVEKRFGIGYTMNFAHPASWIVIGVVILLPLAVAFLLRPHPGR